MSLYWTGKALLFPRPYQAINFPGATIEKVKRAMHIIREVNGYQPDDILPMYMVHDGTYIARCVDIAPRSSLYDDAVRLVGPKYQNKGEKDPSTTTHAEGVTALKRAINRTQEGSSTRVWDPTDLASEIFEVFLHDATAKLHEPCVTILSVAKEFFFYLIEHMFLLFEFDILLPLAHSGKRFFHQRLVPLLKDWPLVIRV